MIRFVKPVVLSFSLLAFAGAAYADDAKKEKMEDKQAQQSTQSSGSASGSTTTPSSQEKQTQQSTQGGASASGSAAGGTSAAAGAQDKSKSQSESKQEQQSQQGQSAAAGASAQGAMPVEKLKDMKVVDSKGEDLGKIEDVVIDLNSGKMHAAVLGVGGFLGLGEKNFAFPPDELKPGKEKNQLTLNVDKQKLKDAQGFEKSAWPGMDDEYWGRMGKGQASAGSGGQSQGQQSQSQGQSSQGVKKNLIRASEMKGKEVQDKSGKQVGKVQDVLVSLNEGQVQSIQIDVQDGGRATVPAKSLSARGTDNKLVIDMSGDQLRSQAKKSGKQAGTGGTTRPMDAKQDRARAQDKDPKDARVGDVDNPLKPDRKEKSEAPK